jgi:EmrB/QacA subfamily drug resistance transporter
LFRTFPPSERVRASSILIIPTAIAPALGPVLGGLLVTHLSWRWVFFVNIPIGVLAVIFGLVFLRPQETPRPGPFDLLGFVLAASGLGLIMYGVSEGPFHGWDSPLIVTTVTVGLGLLLTLVMVEKRRTHPLIDIGLFSDRLFRSTSAVMALGLGAFIGTLFLVALFLQDALGLDALQSGLNTFPEAIGVMLGAQVVTRVLYPVIGPRRVIFGGLIAVAGTMSLLSLVDTTTNLWWVRILMFTCGYSMSHVFVPSQAAGFATITPAATARASTMFNALRQLGSAVGVALLSTVLAEIGPVRVVDGRPTPYLPAYHAAFLTAAAVALVAAVCALTVSDADAAATMVRRRRTSRTTAVTPQPAPVPGC